MKLRIFVLFLCLWMLVGASVEAQPRLDLAAPIAGQPFELRVSARESLDGCSISIFASEDKKLLSRRPRRAAKVFSAVGSNLPTLVTSRSLPSLRRIKGRSAQIYFAALATCSGVSKLSNLRALKLKPVTRRGVASLGSWYRSLKRLLRQPVVHLVPAFSQLRFEKPIDLQSPRDGSNRLFVVEKAGRVRLFNNKVDVAESKLFLDIADRVFDSGERGLLGLAFHPNFSENGYFYVHYSALGSGSTTISRFSLRPGAADEADPNSELILLTETQPFANHNGGQIAFGPDGFLYIALGDGGSGGDPLGNGQNRQTLLGDILRIDVNSSAGGRNYSIPSDNPFVGNGSGFREEIFAYGFRNPWKISFDRLTGQLWVGDVGQNRFEEIDLVEKGKNYGWNTMEGRACFNPQLSCDSTGLTLPVHEYSHAVGASITGGYVYRGSKNPALRGLYLYGDYITGRVWALHYDGISAREIDLVDTESFISSFAEDENGEIYLLSFLDGALFTFESR